MELSSGSMVSRACTVIRAIALVGAAVALPVAAQTAPDAQYVPVTNGLFIVNNPNGRVSYCYNLQSTANPPQSMSNCAFIGALAASTAGYAAVPVGANLYVVSKSSGAIYHCVILIVGSTPVGSCSQRAAVGTL